MYNIIKRPKTKKRRYDKKMKIKCTVCGNLYNRRKDALEKAVKKGKYSSVEEFLKKYVCRKCKKGEKQEEEEEE